MHCSDKKTNVFLNELQCEVSLKKNLLYKHQSFVRQSLQCMYLLEGHYKHYVCVYLVSMDQGPGPLIKIHVNIYLCYFI